MRAIIWTMAWVLAASGVAMARQANAGHAGQNSGGVLILPFKSIDSTGNTSWFADALRQNLADEVGRWQNGATAITPNSAAAATKLDDALKAARAVGASHVVYGSYQLADSGLKITGEVVDVATGKGLGQINSGGAMRDLFAIHDDIAAQLKRLVTVPKSAKAAPALTPPTPAQPKGDLFAIKPRNDSANGWTVAEFPDQGVWSSEVQRAYMEYARCSSILHCPPAMARYWAMRQAYEQRQVYLKRARGGR